MQPLRNTSRDYSLIRSGTRRDTRFSPERLSPNSSGSPCYSTSRTNDVRRASLITNERYMTPGSPYYGESHSQRRGSFSHPRRSDPTPGRTQDSSSAEYPFPSRNGARSYEDEYRSSQERYSRAHERSQFRPGSPGRSDRRSSVLGHSLDRGYRRAADYSSFPREDQYKPPSRADRPAAMQSNNGSNHIPLSDRGGGRSPGRRHDSGDDRRRSRSLSPPVGRRPLPFGESSGDGRRQPVYRGEVGRSSDNEPRLPQERQISRETTSGVVNPRGSLRNERDPNVGGLLPLPGGTLDKQPSSPFASRDAITFSLPPDSGQASHTRLNEQPLPSAHMGRTRPASHSPIAVHLGAGAKHAVDGGIEPRPVPPTALGVASHIAQSNSQTGKITGSPARAPSGLCTDSGDVSILRESPSTGRISQRFAASPTSAGVKDDLRFGGSNMSEVSNGSDSAGNVQTGTKGVSGVSAVSAVPVETVPPENNQMIQKIDTRVSRWSFPDLQSGAKNSLESVEVSSRGQSIKVVPERSVQQQLSQKQQALVKQHQQPTQQQSNSGLQQPLPKDQLLMQGQQQQQQKRPLISPKKQVLGSQQPLVKKQLQSGQLQSVGDCKVSETGRTLSAPDLPNGVLSCGTSARDVSSGAGNATAGQTGTNGNAALRHSVAVPVETASLGDNLVKQKNDPRITRRSLPSAQPVISACQENAEVVSPTQLTNALPEGKVVHKVQQQPLSQKHQISTKQHPLPKQQDQHGQQQLPSKDSLHKQGQSPKQQPNQQVLSKAETPQQLSKKQLPLGQQLPQRRQPQLVLQPKKVTTADAVRPALGHNASLSTDPVQVSETQLATTTTAAPATVDLQLGLFGSIPLLHEGSCGTMDGASEPASSASLVEVALTGASLLKEDSTRASHWSVESPENRDVRSPGFLFSARSDDVGKIQQQQKQLPNLLNSQGKQQHSEQLQQQRAQDQSHQLGRQPKQHHLGQLQVRPKQQQHLGQQRHVQHMQPRITAAGPSSPLLPLPSQCNGGGLLPLPVMQAVVTIASPFGPLTGVVPMAVPVVSTSIAPRGSFQPKQIWQQSRRAAIGHVPALRNVFSNRQQVSYGDLPDLSLCRVVSNAASAAVASTACSTATSTAAVAIGAAMGIDSAADGDAGTIAGAAETVSAAAAHDVTTGTAGGTSIGNATAAKADVTATIEDATAATLSQAHRVSSALATLVDSVPVVQNLSSAVPTKACGLISCSTSPQSVDAAAEMVHSNLSATSENCKASSVQPVASEPAAVSGLQLAVPVDGTATVLGTDKDAAAGLLGNGVETASSPDNPLNDACSARSRKETVFQSVSESAAAPDKECNAAATQKDEMDSKSNAGELLTPCLEHHVKDGKSEVDYPSSSKINRAAEVLLTGKAEAQETGQCQLSACGGPLLLPTLPLIEITSNGSSNFEVPAIAAISVPERPSVQGNTSAIGTPSSPSVKQNVIGVSVRTAHVKPMRKFSTLNVDSCSVESPPGCDSIVAVSSDAGAESQNELKATGISKESLVCKTVVCAEVLSITSSSASSTSANSSSSDGTIVSGCSVRQDLKTHPENDPTVFAAHLDLVCCKDNYRRTDMHEPAGVASTSVNRDGEVGSAPGEPEQSSTFIFTCNDRGNSSTNTLFPKELAKTLGTESSSSTTTVVAPPLLSTASGTDANSAGSGIGIMASSLALPHASTSGMKRVLEKDRDEESSKTPSKHRRKEIDKKIGDDEKCEGKCSQALEEEDMDSTECVVSVQLDTWSKQDDAGCQDTVVHANKSDSSDAREHVTVACAVVSGQTVSSDLICDVSAAKSIMPSLLDEELGRPFPEQGGNDAVNMSDSRLKELLLLHLQSFIDKGEGPFAAVKESRDAAIRHYNSFRERFQKMSADLERACARLSEPPLVVESQHSACELDVVSTQRTRPRLRTVGTQIRTCQFPQTGGPPTTVAVCAMCSTRFHIKSNLLPASSSTQGSRNSVDAHGVVDLTVDEMPVSPSKNVPPAQSNEAKPVTSRDPGVPCVAPSVTSITAESHSSACISTVTVSSGSDSVVTASAFAVAGATTASVVSTLTSAVSLQPNNALGVRSDQAIFGEQSGAAGDFCDKRKLPVGRSSALRSVLSAASSGVAAKVVPVQLLPSSLSMMSTSAGIRPPAAGLPGSSIITAAERAIGKPPSKASRLDVAEGVGYTAAALAKPIGSSNNTLLTIASRRSVAHTLSEKTSMINSASSAASIKGAYLPADYYPEDVNSIRTVQHGTENAVLAVPTTRAAPIESRLEANRKSIIADESLDKPTEGDRAVHYRVGEAQQQSSEKVVLSKEGDSKKKQQESQPLVIEEMPMQPGNAVMSQQHVASTLSDKAESSTSVITSVLSPLVKCPPPLPSDSDWEHAFDAHDGGRPPSPSLDAKWTPDGLELEWNMDLTSYPNTIVKYEVFACKDGLQGFTPWTKVGIIAALPLPMSCCLDQLKRNTVYCFAVRAVNSGGVVGVFSNRRTVPQCE